MNRWCKAFLLFVTLLSCVGCDQVTKVAATRHLKQRSAVSLANNMVRFEYAENRGAFLSMGASLPKQWRFWIFTVSTGLMLLLLFAFLWRFFPQMTFSLALGFTLVLGGGLGNLIDRVFNRGLVVDFVSMGLGSLRTGIFNVADVLIMAGVALVGIEAFRWSGKEDVVAVETAVDPIEQGFVVPLEWEEDQREEL